MAKQLLMGEEARKALCAGLPIRSRSHLAPRDAT